VKAPEEARVGGAPAVAELRRRRLVLRPLALLLGLSPTPGRTCSLWSVRGARLGWVA